MSWQDLVDLMEEPPGGHNHGRRRGPEGGWASLDDREQAARVDDFWIEVDPPKYVRSTNRAFETIRHGTISAYNNQRCRCDLCRLSMAQYRRARRNVQSE